MPGIEEGRRHPGRHLTLLVVLDRPEVLERPLGILDRIQRQVEIDVDRRRLRAQVGLGIAWPGRVLPGLDARRGGQVDRRLVHRGLRTIVGLDLIGMAPLPARLALGELLVQVPRVEEHECRELDRSRRGVDLARKAGLDQERQQAAMIEMGVGQHDRIQLPRCEIERDPVPDGLVGAALEHAAIDEDPGPFRLDEELRAGDGRGATEEVDLHGHHGDRRPSGRGIVGRMAPHTGMRERFDLRAAAPRLPALIVGLVTFGAGIGLMVEAGLGLGPWEALHQGIARLTGLEIGTVSILLGIPIIALWRPLGERPGLGTLLNVVLIGTSTNVAIGLLPTPDESAIASRVAVMVAGVVVIAIGSGIYLSTDLGPGPRDGLMTGLHHRFGWSIRRARTAVELAVLAIGWALGGTVGLGTVTFALGIGPLVQLALRVFDREDRLGRRRRVRLEREGVVGRVESRRSDGQHQRVDGDREEQQGQVADRVAIERDGALG